jgi:hypothetical protein
VSRGLARPVRVGISGAILSWARPADRGYLLTAAHAICGMSMRLEGLDDRVEVVANRYFKRRWEESRGDKRSRGVPALGTSKLATTVGRLGRSRFMTPARRCGTGQTTSRTRMADWGRLNSTSLRTGRPGRSLSTSSSELGDQPSNARCLRLQIRTIDWQRGAAVLGRLPARSGDTLGPPRTGTEHGTHRCTAGARRTLPRGL